MKTYDDNKPFFERNILLLHIINSLVWGRFFIPVIALFYIASKVTIAQFAIIMSVFYLTSFILEIPTGVVADLIGRRNTLIISRSCYFFEILILAFSNGFWPLLAAKVISGIGLSMASGTNSALMYDTLKKLGREKEYKKISGFNFTISRISMAFVFIWGALLFKINNKLPAFASLPFMLTAIILTFFLSEPFKRRKKVTLSAYYHHTLKSFLYFWKNSYLKYLGLYSFFMFGTVTIMENLSSQYYALISIPISIIGVLAFINAMLTAFSSKKAHAIDEKIGEKKALYYSQITLIISIGLMSLMIKHLGVVFLFLSSTVYGFYHIIVNDYMNRRIKSHHRATLLSIQCLFEDLGVVLLFPAVGYLIKIKSMGFALMCTSAVLIIAFIALDLYYKHVQKSGRRLSPKTSHIYK